MRVEDGRAVHRWAACGQADGRARDRGDRAPSFRSSGCPQRSWLWSGVGTSASSGRPIGRHGDRAKHAQSDEAPGSIELDASSPEKCQQVREAHGSTKSRHE